MDREQLLISHRDFYGQYHHRKEQLAYAATVLYLAGAAALMFAETSLAAGSAKELKIIFAVVVSVAAFAFVVWQLRQRQLAADVVEACERPLARFASGETPPALTDPRTYKGLHLPHFLVDELLVVAESRKPFRGTRMSELITYVTMLAVTVLVVIRVIG